MTTAAAPTFEFQRSYVTDRPAAPTAEEIERWRREAREMIAHAAAARRLASWNLGGFTPADVEELRLGRLV